MKSAYFKPETTSQQYWENVTYCSVSIHADRHTSSSTQGDGEQHAHSLHAKSTQTPFSQLRKQQEVCFLSQEVDGRARQRRVLGKPSPLRIVPRREQGTGTLSTEGSQSV